MYDRLGATLVIGFGHRARQGKDSAARFIVEAYPRVDIVRFGFADALRALCRVQYAMTEKDAPLLQRVGVSMRGYDPEVWVRALYWTIRERKPDVALITDARFPNEAAMIKGLGGFMVKVERRLRDGSPYRADDRDPYHESETALSDYPDFDDTIENPDGDLTAFRCATLDAFRYLSAGR